MTINQWNNPIAVAVGILPVLIDGQVKVVGIIRGKPGDDGYGKQALVGGYVNEGESIEEGMAREAREEVGFESSPNDWHLWYSRHIPGVNLNLVFCRYSCIFGGEIPETTNEEVAGVVYLDRTSRLAFNLHTEALQKFYKDAAAWKI